MKNRYNIIRRSSKSLLISTIAFALGISCATPYCFAASEQAAGTENMIPVPLMRQATNYTCGVSALQAVLAYYGQDVREDVLAKILKADRKNGTRYKEIARYAESHDVHVQIFKDMTIAQLEEAIKHRHPVLCLIQAWADTGSQTDYSSDWSDGHYVVAVGFDSEKFVFMDPSTAGHYAFIPRSQFEHRWHDTDGKEKLNHFGMCFLSEKVPTDAARISPID